jgi:DNA end-binding protein Ku
MRSAPPPNSPAPVEISDQEMREAEALMEVIGERDISEFHDEYRAALEQVIEAKLEGREPPEMPTQEAPTGKVMDLMAALEASVSKARESRGEDATVHEMPEKKTTARKTAQKAPAKKTTTKKTAAKKTTTKKAAAKKTKRSA